MMASVSGRRICAVVPAPGSEVSSDLAAELADLGAHRVHADAAAGDVVGRARAVEKPGVKSSSMARGHVDRVGLLGGDEPARGRPCAATVRGIDAAAVVAHRDDHVAAGVAGGDARASPVGGLAGGLALVRASRGRGRARCARGARAGRRARRRRCGRARCPGRRARSSTCLPSLVERSRTSRGKRRKTASTGIIRTCMTIACRACEQRVRSCMACERPGTSAWAASDLDLGALDDELAHEVHAAGRAARRRRGRSRRRGPPRRARRPRRGRAAGATGSASPTIAGLGDLGDLGARRRRARRSAAALSAAASTPAAIHTSTRRPSKASTCVLLRGGGDDGAQLGGRGEDHVGAHGRHQGVVGQRRRERAASRWPVPTASTTAVGHRRGRGAAVARDLLVGRAVADEALQALDERRRAPAPRRRRRRSASTAPSSASRHSSRTSTASRVRPPVRWRSSSKTSSISCVRAAMPAKPMVALMPFSEWAMRKISSTVAPVVGLLLDAHDGEVELLQVLAALGEEHREVLGACPSLRPS